MWPLAEWRLWCSGSSATKPKYEYTQNFQNDRYSRDTGTEDFVLLRILFTSSPKSTTSLTRKSCYVWFCEWLQPWLHIVWYSLHGWGPLYLGQFYQHKEFIILEHKNPHAVSECLFQHQFPINVRCGVLGNNLMHQMLLEDVQQLHITGTFWKMNYHCIYRLCLLQHENKCSWLQHDGALLYFVRTVSDFLN